MVGRALVDYFMREGANVKFEQGGAPVSINGNPYSVLKGTSGWVSYELSITSQLFENEPAKLEASLPVGSFANLGDGFPGLEQVTLNVMTRDKQRTDYKKHTGRAFLWNRDRYRYD